MFGLFVCVVFFKKKINNGSLIELKTYDKLFLTFYQCTPMNTDCLVPISFLVLQVAGFWNG